MSYEPALYRALMCIHLGFEPLCVLNWAWERGLGMNHSSKRDGLKTGGITAHSKAKYKSLGDFPVFYRQTGGIGGAGGSSVPLSHHTDIQTL